ncbi:aldehyde dehydrogenase family protein [Nibricoccus sp. IMCC34717]|uniref:aldehyde dehydrogenase family protein n=1 Tax=Nibricoccus sp. IMCC34717 TaxID=3034021 RepID=UPI00384EF3D3
MTQSPLHFDLYIDGKPAPGTGGKPAEVRNPHDGSLVATVAAASTADLDLAVASSQRAFAAWSQLTAYERESRIKKSTTHVRTQAEAIGLLMAREQGKPLAQCKSEVVGACDTIDYYAAEAVRIEGSINPTESTAYRSWVTYQPVGVCGLITPWNYPVSLLSWKLGPALATGCAVIVKPTSVTPLSPHAFCRALIEGGLPSGLVNVVTGSGSLLGDALVKHPGVAKIAMTGSSDTGKRILSAAGPYLKKVSLELGGQCPAIVCADADLDNAAKVVSYKGFRNGGQSCSSVNRVYVHASVAEAFVEKLRAFAEKHSIGDPVANPTVDLGPMATRGGVETAEAHVRDAVAKGARLVCGGQAPTGEVYSKGHYYLPTVIAGATHAMEVMREETFGPLVAVATFTDLEEAIRLANDTHYGLVSYLFTRDLSTTVRVSERLDAGTVCVNHGAVNTNYGPYAGWKESGYGLELSRRAVFEYLKVKHIKVQI